MLGPNVHVMNVLYEINVLSVLGVLYMLYMTRSNWSESICPAVVLCHQPIPKAGSSGRQSLLQR